MNRYRFIDEKGEHLHTLNGKPLLEKHGPHYVHGMSRTKIYETWGNMKKRCEDKTSLDYKNYGARGINVSKPWQTFTNFYKDMGAKPDGMTLERLNNNKGYSKANCKWATRHEQNNNSRRNKWVSFIGYKLTVSQWARKIGIDPDLMSWRLLHWDKNKSLTQPQRKSPTRRIK